MDLFLAPICFCQAHTALTIYDIEAIYSILGDNFQIDPEQRFALIFGDTYYYQEYIARTARNMRLSYQFH